MTKQIKKLFTILSLLACITIPANAGDFGALGTTGNWTNSSTWTPSGVPGAGDRVFVGGTFVGGQDLVAEVDVDSVLSISAMYIGGFSNPSGQGTLNVASTGIITNTGFFSLGFGAGASVVNLDGGIVATGGNELHIGGNSAFNQNGANSTNIVGGRLIVSIGGGRGTYNMNDGYLEVGSTLHTGFDTTNGTFNQSGGFVWAKGEFWVNGAHTNIYNMSGGTLVSTNGRDLIGATSGTLNRFNQTGGTATFSDLQVAHTASVQGEYILNGGRVNTPSLIVNGHADSKFEFLQGALNVNNVTLAAGKGITAGNGTDRAVITVSNNVTGGNGITVADNSIFGVVGAKNITTLTNSYLDMNAGAGWGGTGTLTGGWAYENGSTVAPGNSPGTFSQVGAVSFGSGGNYDWEINSFGGTAGIDPGWDLFDVDGTLTISATSMNQFNINLLSLTLANAAGNVSDFDQNLSYSNRIAQATSITGFAADKFNINTAGFSNPFAGTWSVGLQNSDTELWLYYQILPIPEPSTYAMLALGLVMSAYGLRISSRKKKALKS